MKTFAATLLLILPAGLAAAGDLPGVEQPKTIVQPLPEPLDEQAATTDDGRIKVGDWDVKVSGSITVDVGVGNIKPPKR